MKSEIINIHLTAKEVAQRLHRSVHYLATLRSSGDGPRYIPGRPVLYPLVEVEKWEQSRLVQSTAEKSSYSSATQRSDLVIRKLSKYRD